MKLTRVTQEDDTGCGIGCVAVLGGISYRESKTIFLEDVFSRKRRKYRAYHKHIEAALDAAGIPNRRRSHHRTRSFYVAGEARYCPEIPSSQATI